MKKLFNYLVAFIIMIFALVMLVMLIGGIVGRDLLSDDDKLSDMVTAIVFITPIILLLIYNLAKYFIDIKNGVIELENTIDESISNYEIYKETNTEMIQNINAKIETLIQQENKSFDSGLNHPTDSLVYVNHSLSNFPELKSDKSIMRASAEITNRISELRIQKTVINNSIKNYNVTIKKFPNTLVIKNMERKEFL